MNDKYKIEKIEILGAKIDFFKLFINEKCLFDDFLKEVEKSGNYNKEIEKIKFIMNEIALNNYNIPSNWFKELVKNKNDIYKDYEIRTNNLRVYLFKQEKTGHIIVLAGIKKPKEQDKDIEKMRVIKKEYFRSLKVINYENNRRNI